MDTKNITFLNNIDPQTDEYTFKLCIIRLWRQPMKGRPEKTYSIEMILMDEQGTKIQANVLNRLFDNFERYLEQGSALYVYRPSLREFQSKYRYTKHTHKMHFVGPTKVKKCNDFGRSVYGLDFATYQSIISGVYDETEHFDVIGEVCKVYGLVNTSKDPNIENWRYNMFIQDLDGVQLNCTLWGNVALQMDAYVKNQNTKRKVIIALQLAKVRVFNEIPYVQSSWDISRLFINCDITEINDFKNAMKASAKKELSSGQMSIVSAKTITEEFLQGKFITFDEIMEITKPQSFIVLGTVNCIGDKSPWFYDGCTTCKHKATKDFDIIDNPDEPGSLIEVVKYLCGNEKCKKKGKETDMEIRYKITLRVQDTKATVSLTLFDNDARALLGKSAEILVKEHQKREDGSKLPPDFNVLVSKQFAFKVDVTPFNIENNYYVYTISKLTDNKEIISALQQNLNFDNDAQQESFNGPISGFTSETDKVVNDAGSYTGGLAKPSSVVESSTATSPFRGGKKQNDVSGTPPTIKRNLVDVYDVDDVALMSTSKSKTNETLCVERKSGFEEKALKVPKLEK